MIRHALYGLVTIALGYVVYISFGIGFWAGVLTTPLWIMVWVMSSAIFGFDRIFDLYFINLVRVYQKIEDWAKKHW